MTNSTTQPSVPAGDNFVRRCRLTSTEAINASGILRWAQLGYQASIKQQQAVAPFIAVMADGFGLGVVLAERVLRGEIKYVIEDSDVILLMTEQDVLDLSVRNAALLHRDLPVISPQLELLDQADAIGLAQGSKAH
jgi:hypothetical protein